MPSKIAALALLMLTQAGCIFVPWGGGGGGGGGGGVAGDVTFTWSFDGRTCAAAGVSTVAIAIDGESLQNNGVYSCLTDNYPGIQLNNFRPRTYTYSIVGRGYSGEDLYEFAGTFTVNGDVRVTVDLDRVVQSTNVAYLAWTFPPNGASSNPSCSQAGVTTVYVSIDGAAEYSVACTAGWSTTGVQTQVLSVGSHSIDLSAVDSSGYRYYAKRSTLLVQAGTPVLNTYALDWAVGGAAVAWTLVDGTVARTCAQAGITQVTVNFQDTTSGALLYGMAGDVQPCTAGAVKYDFLTPGRYKVLIEGAGSGGSLYTSNTTLGAPEVTITAGVFKSTSDAQNVVMYRVQ